jgi:hypothetical protein
MRPARYEKVGTSGNTPHLSDKLAACNAAAPQAVPPSLPTIVPKITPYKADKPATETSGNIQGKRKASGTPPRPQQNSANPVATFAAATVAAAASAAAAIAAATTAVTTTAATGTSASNALEVPDSDSDDTDDTIPPPAFSKKEHRLTLIHGMDIKQHLGLIKSDLSIVFVKLEPGAPNTRYINWINFLATVLAKTEAPVSVMNLLPHIENIGNRKDVRTDDIIRFLTTNGVELTPLTNDYKTTMTTDHTRPIIIEYTVLRHPYENKDLPASWLQFSLLLRKEKLLVVPFNQTGDAINLGRQFNEQKWTRNFNHYCMMNLNYRIAPIDRTDKKGPQGPKIIVRGLEFNNAWAITMPAPDPKP